MWPRSQKSAMPSPEDAPVGRAERMVVPATHFVSDAPLVPPFPAGMEMAMFGMGCFWGAERKFWEAKACTRRPWAMRQGLRRTRRTRKSVAG